MTDAVPTTRYSRKGLIIPFALVLIGLALWTGYWFYLTQEIEKRFGQKVAQLEQSGWTIQHGKMSTTGWPLRATVTFTNLDVKAPSGHAFLAPQFVAEANAYNPTHWIMAAPDGLIVTRGEKGKVAIKAKAIRMSLKGLTQRWPDVAFELTDPVFTPLPDAEPFPLKSARLVQLHMRPHRNGEAKPNDDVDVLFRLVDAVGRDGGPVEGLTQSGKLNVQVESVLEKASGLRQANERGLLAAWTGQGGRFVNLKGQLMAGESRTFIESPALTATDKGQLEGEVYLRAEKPLAALVGLAGVQHGSMDRAAAARAAAATPQGGTGEEAQGVELVVAFRNGRSYLGPFAMAPAPQLF